MKAHDSGVKENRIKNELLDSYLENVAGTRENMWTENYPGFMRGTIMVVM